MACGCPVVAFNQGSIPEVIKNGKTGFVVRNLGQMIRAVREISKINRLACRAHAISKFSVKNMTDGYEAIYKQILTKKYYQQSYTQSDSLLFTQSSHARPYTVLSTPPKIAKVKSKSTPTTKD